MESRVRNALTSSLECSTAPSLHRSCSIGHQANGSLYTTLVASRAERQNFYKQRKKFWIFDRLKICRLRFLGYKIEKCAQAYGRHDFSRVISNLCLHKEHSASQLKKRIANKVITFCPLNNMPFLDISTISNG